MTKVLEIEYLCFPGSKFKTKETSKIDTPIAYTKK